jgi:hypothetical protein
MARSRRSRSEVTLPPTVPSTMSLVAALADRRRADRAPDPGRHCLDLFIARGGFEPRSPVEVADGGKAPSKRAGSFFRGLTSSAREPQTPSGEAPTRPSPVPAPDLEYTPVARVRRPPAWSWPRLRERSRQRAHASPRAAPAAPAGRLRRGHFPSRPPPRMRVIGTYRVAYALYVYADKLNVNTIYLQGKTILLRDRNGEAQNHAI